MQQSLNCTLKHLTRSLEEKGLTVTSPIAMPQYVILRVSFRTESTDIRVQVVNQSIAVEFDPIEQPSFLKRIQQAIQSLPKGNIIKPNYIEHVNFQMDADVKITPNISDLEYEEPLKNIDTSDAISIVIVGTKNFFGPVVMAAVHCPIEQKQDVRDLLDLKKPSKYSNLESTQRVEKIMEICEHSAIIMGNKSYNEFYGKFQNIQLVYSWGICRMLKNVSKQMKLESIFTNGFGSFQLINHETKKLSPEVKITQKTDRQHIASKIATLIANLELANQLGLMNRSYKFEFPLGSEMVVQSDAYKFVEKFGKEQLENVAKLNFPLFEELENKKRTLKSIKRIDPDQKGEKS